MTKDDFQTAVQDYVNAGGSAGASAVFAALVNYAVPDLVVQNVNPDDYIAFLAGLPVYSIGQGD